MKDPRLDRLAEVLIDHSCELPEGETLLIEAFEGRVEITHVSRVDEAVARLGADDVRRAYAGMEARLAEMDRADAFGGVTVQPYRVGVDDRPYPLRARRVERRPKSVVPTDPRGHLAHQDVLETVGLLHASDE